MENLDEYQQFTKSTAVYPKEFPGEALSYVTLGLCGEAGEIANKVKKILRDDDGVLGNDKAAQLAKELGDVMWYVSQIACELGYSLNDVIVMNVKKLTGRKERGTLKGSGDNR